MGDVGDWSQCVALKERKLRGWIYFEDGNNIIVCISKKEKSRAFGLGNMKDGATII